MEYTIRAIQIERGIKFLDLTVRHDQDPIVIDNSTKSMSNREERLVLEFLSNRRLDLRVGSVVDRGGRFVQYCAEGYVRSKIK